jgi:hypothetical protein
MLLNGSRKNPLIFILLPKKIIISGCFTVSLIQWHGRNLICFISASQNGIRLARTSAITIPIACAFRLSLSLAPFPLEPDVKLNPGHSRSAYSAAHAAEGVSLLALTAPKIRIVSENKESAEHLHGNDGAQRERGVDPN